MHKRQRMYSKSVWKALNPFSKPPSPSFHFTFWPQVSRPYNTIWERFRLYWGRIQPSSEHDYLILKTFFLFCLLGLKYPFFLRRTTYNHEREKIGRSTFQSPRRSVRILLSGLPRMAPRCLRRTEVWMDTLACMPYAYAEGTYPKCTYMYC